MLRYPISIMALALMLGGCARAPTGTSSAAVAGGGALSPRETLVRLIAARQAGDSHTMEALICPTHAPDVIATLLAVDGFLTANRQLCDYIRDHVALGLSQSIDQSYLGENLDIFSGPVELLDETIDGDQARVAFVVDERLPAKHARLQCLDGVWRYDAGPGYDPALPQAFEHMARGLRQVLTDLQSGRLSPQQVRDDPQSLVDQVRLRLLPGVRMLPRPPQTQPADDQ
ncbi:MAG: hypothetical protein KKB50_17695 [Planctomycetes bacterium]|nr:hypothetical protein [Planctomycetota bacterium]